MNERLKVYDDKMQKTIKSLDSELGTIRAGRANPKVLDRIMVDYYGSPTPLQQVGNISDHFLFPWLNLNQTRFRNRDVSNLLKWSW